jgi:hypothetical protein
VCTKPGNIGSTDVENALSEQVMMQAGPFAKLKPHSTKEEATANEQTCQRQILLIIHARLSIFRIFIECAKTTPDGLQG